MKVGKITFSLNGVKSEHLISDDVMLIGRKVNEDNAVIIDNPTVSRLHAKIIRKNKHFIVENLSTHQPTFVNAKPINDSVELHHRDILRLGSVFILFTIENVDEESLLVNTDGSTLNTSSIERVKKEIKKELQEDKEIEQAFNESERENSNKDQEEDFYSDIPEESKHVRNALEAKLDALSESLSKMQAEEEKSNAISNEAENEQNVDTEDAQEVSVNIVEISDDNNSIMTAQPVSIETVESDSIPEAEQIEEAEHSKDKNTSQEIDKVNVKSARFADDEEDIESEVNEASIVASNEVVVVPEDSDSEEDSDSQKQTDEIHHDIEESMHAMERKQSEPEVVSNESNKLSDEENKQNSESEHKSEFLIMSVTEESLLREELKNKAKSLIVGNDESETTEACSMDAAEEMAHFLELEKRVLCKQNAEIIYWQQRKNIPLQYNITRVGTSKDNDVQIKDLSGEPYEFEIYLQNEQYFIHRRGRLEIRVNDTVANENTSLYDGDVIQYGQQTFYFFDGSEIAKELYHTLIFLCTHPDDSTMNLPFLTDKRKYSFMSNDLACYFQRFGQNKGKIALFAQENATGLYLCLCETVVQNDYFIAWLQGIFTTAVTYLDQCSDILKEMNNYILQSWRCFEVHATILHFTETSLIFAQAGNSFIIQKNNQNEQSIIWSFGLPLGITKKIFIQEKETRLAIGDMFLLPTEKIAMNLGQNELNTVFSYKKFDHASMNQDDFFNTLANMIKAISNNETFGVLLLQYCNVQKPKEIEKEKEKVFICSKCGKTYSSAFRFCPEDGTKLQ